MISGADLPIIPISTRYTALPCSLTYGLDFQCNGNATFSNLKVTFARNCISIDNHGGVNSLCMCILCTCVYSVHVQVDVAIRALSVASKGARYQYSDICYVSRSTGSCNGGYLNFKY